MQLINTIDYYVNVIIVVVSVVMALAAGLLYYLIKVKRINAKTEKINYNSFYRKDALEYVKFDDVISEGDSMKTPGVIVLGNNTFVAGVDIVGYNFAAASAEERQRTMINAVSFANYIDAPIQMRQTVQAVDLSYNIGIQENILNELRYVHDELVGEYERVMELLGFESEDSDDYQTLEQKRKRLIRTIQSKRHSIQEGEMLLQYMKKLSGGTGADAQKINHIMFSYVFNPNEYTEELSQEEIYLKAMDALDTKAASYSNGLSLCGCTCRRLTGMQCVELMRKHMNPLSSEEISIEVLFNSSYNCLFVTSDSLIELEIAKIGEEAYNRQLEAMIRDREELLRQQEEGMSQVRQNLAQFIKSEMDGMEVTA